ncbi:response regulator [Rossellomorea aquimaris]|uniref:response regulator n=1 Tax=Rossellomorea aquimaris TaxID=189382 RepID=UPI0007D0B38B|nr:response regulator [Rossellomorea aquimaris]
MANLLIYQKKLIENIRKQLSTWFTLSTPIKQMEIERFLHSITGTAPTIELDELGKLARNLHEHVKELGHKEWLNREVQELVAPILTICYQYENNHELELPMNQENSLHTQVVFIIDDDVTILMILKDFLEKQGFQVFAFRNSEKALSALYDIKPDCILLDIFLEDENGLQTLEHITQMVQRQYVPIMMMSGDSSDVVRMTSYEKGADDFLLKPFKLKELEIRLTRQIQRKQFVDELILMDELTKLYNRKYFAQVFNQYCSKQWEADHDNERLSIAFLDLDHFKKINDQHGHLIGDTVLKKFSQFVSSKLETKDIFIRFGGEEFLILFPNQRAESVQEKLAVIQSDFHKEIFTNSHHQFSVSFSGGIVEIDSAVSTSPAYWLDLADIALYTSKELGRNKLTIYSQQQLLPEKAVSIAIVEDDIIMQLLLMNLLKQISSDSKKLVHIERYKSGEDFIESEWTVRNNEGIVLLNMNMEGINGIETLEKVDLSRFMVLMLSAQSLSKQMEKAIAAGINDYVKKPFKISTMEQKLKFYLEFFD